MVSENTSESGLKNEKSARNNKQVQTPCLCSICVQVKSRVKNRGSVIVSRVSWLNVVDIYAGMMFARIVVEIVIRLLFVSFLTNK